MQFKDFDLRPSIQDALNKKGFDKPTPIQEKVIPILLENDINVIGQAQTGTGKTAAFSLPVLNNIDTNSNEVQALVLAPTRELANQVAEEMISFKGDLRVFVTTVYGGQSISVQKKQLRKGSQIVVGTPGRVMDLMRQRALDISNIKYFILDEADEMLNMGFIDDIDWILDHTPEEKQTLLFSATMPKKILQLAKKYMGDYELLAVKKQELTTDRVEQLYYQVNNRDKLDVLKRVLLMEPNFYGIVFCNMKVECDRIANALSVDGFKAEALHGDLAQKNREFILKRFKDEKTKILVATDVAARGIDVDHLTHVINHSLPQDPEAYVHRIGRTGRAGREGTAISLVEKNSMKQLSVIENITKKKLTQANFPEAKDIIENKKALIKNKILTTTVTNEDATFTQLANELIQELEYEDALVAVLKAAYGKELSPKAIRQIKQPDFFNKNYESDEQRLFVAKGKKDGMGKQQIKDMIMRKISMIEDEDFLDVYVLDEFSFVTLPKEKGELVESVFKRDSKGKKSLITKAKAKNSGGGGGRSDKKFSGGGRGGNRRGKTYGHSKKGGFNKRRSKKFYN